jgi:DNA-directed RNA polymerase sigma subunit (sigma70/sigma32)
MAEVNPKPSKKVGRPRKYADEYSKQQEYFQTPKGIDALEKYNLSERRKVTNRWLQQDTRRSPSPNRRNDFLKVYGNPSEVLEGLDPQARKIVELYCGLTDEPPLLMEIIALRVGLPLKEVKSIKSRTLKSL